MATRVAERKTPKSLTNVPQSTQICDSMAGALEGRWLEPDESVSEHHDALAVYLSNTQSGVEDQIDLPSSEDSDGESALQNHKLMWSPVRVSVPQGKLLSTLEMLEYSRWSGVL
jgi:hypothetical protein